MLLGLDIGSTTVKAVAIDEKTKKILFCKYMRHYSDPRGKAFELFDEMYHSFRGGVISIAASGSGAISFAEDLGIPFVQEVVACIEGIKTYVPDTDVAIELGGEDGKITFFDEANIDQRMNEVCAGGTGAFIDQMASVLKTDAAGLDKLAADHTNLYPIAARCGVFAKTDIMPLLNEGAPRENIAASIFQAVVDQTIGGLACGRPIKGKVAFLGGPLTFLPQLRKRFTETLKLKPENIIFPENSQYFVAIGAALLAQRTQTFTLYELFSLIEKNRHLPTKKKEKSLPSLFNHHDEYKDFKKKHSPNRLLFDNIENAKGDVYLGLDAGSTTTKAILINEEKKIFYSWYGSNNGNPLASAITLLNDLYLKLPKEAKIRTTAVTGYGEALLQNTLGFDIGEVETIAHYKAAAYFDPDVSFILDIGGQDIKCIYVKNGIIEKIILNEACSSGCGSFIENFASSLKVPINEFVDNALFSKYPIDLGSRCTVFMNSRIKQAQREGVDIGDISAGLAYSVVRNALYKVIKISHIEELGNNIVVQGGTFRNDAVLRAFEKTIGKEVTISDIPGIMGAFGAALLAADAKEKFEETSLISSHNLKTLKIDRKTVRCGQCSNNCLLSISTFGNNKKFVSGNRCEKGAQENKGIKHAFNMYKYKYKRLFDDYIPLEKNNAPKGEIGIPRVLNIYENYPFWFTLFTELGFRVVLSDKSSRSLFISGLETIPSQTVCYPAKIAHGHILDLIKKGVKNIFYPCIPREKMEFLDSDDDFNCPIVGCYPEVIRLNVFDLKEKNINFIQPFLPINNPRLMRKRLSDELKSFDIPVGEFKKAIKAAYNELNKFKHDIRAKGVEVVNELKEKKMVGIVLAGRPYHIDPLINHGIPENISESGITVLTEDSVADLGAKLRIPLYVVDQWVYHSRLYRAANFVAQTDNIEFVQLNSFGCGIDAITTEQTETILRNAGKTFTVLKIDEGANLGATRIRMRSLLATVNQISAKIVYNKSKNLNTANNASKLDSISISDYTILCPQMSPIHFEFIYDAFKPFGYNIVVLPDISKSEITEEGLRYVNNDACYPAIIVVGQMIAALKSGKYDTRRTALLISQTSGGCRATNYVSFLKNALMKAGFSDVPVITLNMAELRKTKMGFTFSMLYRLLISMCYGDLLMRVSNATRPYEKEKGSVQTLLNYWIKKCKTNVANGNRKEFLKNVKTIVTDFEKIPMTGEKKPKVGIVGEILVKFHPGANNQLVSIIEDEGGEAVIPDLIDFINYCLLDKVNSHNITTQDSFRWIFGSLAVLYIETFYRRPMRKALDKSRFFLNLNTTYSLAQKVKGIISLSNQTGEGWLLTAEMVELIEEDIPNIICVQPFGCLPNHITGKGVIKELKARYKKANIVAIDYDTGDSEVNQLNRIKLMMGMRKDRYQTD